MATGLSSSGNSKQPTKNKQHGVDHLTTITAVTRVLSLLLIGAVIYWNDVLEHVINNTWTYLLSSFIYKHVYFETWFTIICYLFINLYPFTLDRCRWLDRYKIDHSMKYQTQTVVGMSKEAVTYAIPFMILDTCMVKKYCGIDPSVWDEKRLTWIQSSRALPQMPPTLWQLSFHLMGSLVMFDVFFFLVHYTLHQNSWLYKNVHKWHHTHEVLECHVTNKLTYIERVTLVLSANFALKVFNSHPLTRTVFVPVFILLLVENHLGYDFPWSLSNVFPFKAMGGARKHHAHHHTESHKFYQPLFNYLDKFLEKQRNKVE